MLLQVAIITVALFGPALYSWLRYKRFKQYAYFPQMPSSLLWGHMKAVDDFIKAGKPMGHPGKHHNLFPVPVTLLSMK